MIQLQELKLLLSKSPETNYYRIIPRLQEVVTRSKCDILHFHDSLHYTTDSMTIFGAYLNLPMVLTIHGFMPSNGLFKFLFRLYYTSVGYLNFTLVDRIILPSRSLFRSIVPLKAFKDKVRIIPNGVITKECAPKKYSLPINLLAVGRLVPRKGFQFLIQAMPILLRRFPGIKLKIVGPDGGYTKNLEQLIDKYNLKESVELLGCVSDHKLEELYLEASICVNPSTWENAPLTVLEGLSWGNPVVSCDVGGVSEVIKNQYNGVLVTPSNSSEISKAITLIALDPLIYDSFSVNALTTAKALSWEKIAIETESVYSEIFKNN